MLPTSMSLRCSLSDVAWLIARIVAAEATAYAIPMIASCGMRAWRILHRREDRGAEKVNARPVQ